MQDGAPAHSSAFITAELTLRGVRVISWPPYSPNLNLIKIAWNWMKDYIQDKWGINKAPTPVRLRRYVQEAWEQLPDSYLAELLALMQARYQAVIDANGMYTRF